MKLLIEHGFQKIHYFIFTMRSNQSRLMKENSVLISQCSTEYVNVFVKTVNVTNERETTFSEERHLQSPTNYL